MVALWTVIFMLELVGLGFGAWMTYRYSQGYLHTIPRFASGCLVTLGWRDASVLLVSLSLLSFGQMLAMFHALVIVRVVLGLAIALLWNWLYKRHKPATTPNWAIRWLRPLRGQMLTKVFAGAGFLMLLRAALQQQAVMAGYLGLGGIFATVGTALSITNLPLRRVFDVLVYCLGIGAVLMLLG